MYSRVRLQFSQLLAIALSSIFLLGVVFWALTVRLLAAIPKILWSHHTKEERQWDDAQRWSKEKLVKDVRYYAETCGFKIINETCETEDGYYLRVNRVIDPTREHEKHSDGRGGFPVLIMHGLFQSSGSFVTSEERSLPFWLARQGGYQVFLGNNRGVFDMGHRTFKRSDPRFWDYNIRELAIYDLPALVDYVRKQTGYDKIGFIGHSQGNGTAFISLSTGMVPELGEKLTYFGALAPAVFAGPLTSCFPFSTLRTMEWSTWKRFFGVLDFIPLMKYSYDWTPAYPYALLGYQIFAFLFAWTDANWLLRRKAKMFRFTPQPVSSASIYWWAGKDGFASRGCVLDPTAE
jgi:lysosomal acid lipase/cholesteryl ester hydrolase